ncbi:MAG: transposase [Rhodopila sp.]
MASLQRNQALAKAVATFGDAIPSVAQVNGILAEAERNREHASKATRECKEAWDEASRSHTIANSGFGSIRDEVDRRLARAVARRLLLYIIERLLPDGEIVIGIDDSIERRWGARIKARGIYRDPVRSSNGLKTSGLRWLSLMVTVPIPWAARTWALPFLTILAPSARWSETHGKRHKTLTDWGRQAILQTKRWLPNRRLVFVADSSFSALGLLAAVSRHVCVITRLRLDASPFRPPPRRRKGQRGRPPLKARALPKLSATVWSSVVVSQWYNAQRNASCWSPPAPRSGTMPASRRCRSAGCWSAIRPASMSHPRFSARTWMRHRR